MLDKVLTPINHNLISFNWATSGGIITLIRVVSFLLQSITMFIIFLVISNIWQTIYFLVELEAREVVYSLITSKTFCSKNVSFSTRLLKLVSNIYVDIYVCASHTADLCSFSRVFFAQWMCPLSKSRFAPQ